MYPVSIVVWERLESLDDWFGSINWLFLSKITKSSESPISSKLIEHKSLELSNLFSASDKLLLGAFAAFEWGLFLLFGDASFFAPFWNLPWNVLGGKGGGANAKQFGGFLSFAFGAFSSVCGWLADEWRLAFVGDADLTCKLSVFSSTSTFLLSNRSTKHSVGKARLEARFLLNKLQSTSQLLNQKLKCTREKSFTFSLSLNQKTRNAPRPQFALPGLSLRQWFNVEKDLQGDKGRKICQRASVSW